MRGGLSRTTRAVAPTRRRLQVTVLECRSLKKMDGRFGDNDVFVTVDVDGQELSTQTVHDGGTAPRWNGGAGETLVFAPPDVPETLLVSAFDEDSQLVDSVASVLHVESVVDNVTGVLDNVASALKLGSESEDGDRSGELIGTERVSLKFAAAAAPSGDDWSTCEWYTLTDEKDNKTGEVRLFLRWAGPLPVNAPMQWQLHATILECRKLKKMDMIGKNDVYVRLHAHGASSSARTTTIEEGGAAPKWGTETTPGEALDLQLSEAPPALGIEVWEEDKLKSDLIGGSVLEIGTKITKDGWSWSGWSELTDYKRGKVTGEVRLRLVWRYVQLDDLAADARQFHVTILECRGLKNVDGFRGLNDVYVIADVDGEAHKSSVVDDGGAAPRWNGGAGETMEFSPKTAPKSLRIGVMDKNKSADKDIGRCGVALAHRPADQDWTSCEWYSLKDDKGKETGEIRVFLRWALPDLQLPLTESSAQDWALQVTVIECSGLKKMDRLGKNDVYVCVNALGDADDGQRTSTIDDGGDSPVWGNGAGETVNMWLRQVPPAVGIEVYDQDRLSSDLIGSHVLEIGTRLAGDGWKTEGWYDLTDQAQGVQTGKVHVQLLWKRVRAVNPDDRRLRVTVLECRNLKKMDLIGDNDVYVAVHIDGEVLKTSVIDDGGAAPRWNSGSGQELAFTPKLGDPRTMLLRAFDQDKTVDELIGTHACTLDDHVYHHDWSSCDWYPLCDENGESCGEVRLFLRWSVPPWPRDSLEQEPTRGEWHLQTTVFECRALKKMNIRGENHVYVRVHALGANKPLQTSTIQDGGEAPMWAAGQGEALNMYMDEPPPSVGIEVFADTTLSNDLIGCNVLEIGSKVGTGKWGTDGWFELIDREDDTIVGEIRVQLTWKLAPVVDPYSRRLLVAVLECRDLRKMNKLGQNDVFVTVEVDDEEMSTSVMDSGGAAPKWNGGAGEAMMFTPLFEPQSLRVRVFDKGTRLGAQLGSDELIGTHVESLRRMQKDRNTDTDVPLTHHQRLMAAYEEESAGVPGCAPEEAVEQIAQHICRAVEEATEAQAAAIKDGNDWVSCEWYDVVDENGRIAGAVRLFLRWAVPLPKTSPREWQLLATVYECSSLKSMETLGKNDVFVKVQALGTAKTKEKPDGSERTRTIEDGGAAPNWGDAGEELDLRLFEVPPSVGVEVYEEDLVKSDLIGCHVLDVGTQIGEGEWKTEGWYELSDNTGTVVGRVRLKVAWLIAPLEDISYAAAKISGDWRRQHLIEDNRRRALELDQRRRDVKKMKLSLGYSNKKSGPKVRQVENLDKCLQVFVLECRELRKMGRGLNDPYVTIDVDAQTLKSSTVDNGGAAPRWGNAAGELMVFASSIEPAKMCIRVFDKATIGEDELIGAHNLVVGALASTKRGAKSGPGITFRRAHLAREELQDLSKLYARNAYRALSTYGDNVHVEQVLHDVCKAVSDSAEVVQTAAKAGRDWSSCEWLNLTNEQGKTSGAVRIFFRWGARPLADGHPCEWQLRATVIECTKLKSVAQLGSNDVFVQVQALGADSSVRTSTINEGGASPVWRDGDGEQLELRLRQAPPVVGIQVYDEGTLFNTLIGSYVLEVASRIGAGPWSTEGWFDVTDFKAGKTTGRVHMRLDWSLVPAKMDIARRLTYSQAVDGDEEAEQVAAELDDTLMASVLQQYASGSTMPEIGGSKKSDTNLPTYACLEACLLECRGLRQMDLFEMNDVFVTLNLDGDTQRSATIHSGGASPSWNGGAGQHLLFRSRKFPSNLRIRTFSEDGDECELIGCHELCLEHRWKLNPAAGEEWQSNEWYPLKDAGGDSTGEVRIALRWQVPRVWTVPEWRLRVAVLACSDLKKMDTLGKNDVFVQVNVMGANKAQRTCTIEAGGSAPVWSNTDELMIFKLGEPPPSIGIEVYDEDHVVTYAAHATQEEHRGRDDRLIGFHVYELGSKLQQRADPSAGEWSTEGWLEIHDRTGQPAGRIHIRFQWMHDPLMPPPPAPLPKQEREICFLLDEDAHAGGTLNRTVTFLRGSVASLQQEASSRFNRGTSPTRFQRSSQVFRDECLPTLSYKRSFRDAYEHCDVQLVYVVEDGLEGVCAQPVNDPLLVARVSHELEKRWVYVDRKAERDAARAAGIFEDDNGEDDESTPFWQLWVGHKATPDVRFETPPPLPARRPVRLASVTTDSELAALTNDRQLYASIVRTSHRQLPSQAVQDAAAIVIQTHLRGHFARVATRAEMDAVLMAQRCCHRYVSRAILRRYREAHLRKIAEAEAEAALRAHYDALLNRGNTMASSMDDLLADMHQIIGVNEKELKGTDGWTVYERSRKNEADAALATLTDSINDRSSATELQHALDLYVSCSVSDPAIEEQMRTRIASKRVAEADATAKLRASTAQCTGQAEALVAQFRAKIDDPFFVTPESAASGQKKSRRDDRILKAGDTRRWAMVQLLADYKKVLDSAEAAGVVAAFDINSAREVHAELLAEEEARIADEDAIREAKQQSLLQAFDRTLLHFFSPDIADGKTAYERTLEAAAAAKKRQEWAKFEQKFNTDGEEIVPPPNDGHAVGVFRELHGDTNKKMMVIPPSNELITPAYAAMIASRHPEEKRRRRRPEAEAAKKYSYSPETDPFQSLRMPDAKKPRPRVDSRAQQLAHLHPLLEDGLAESSAPMSTGVAAIVDKSDSSRVHVDDHMGSAMAHENSSSAASILLTTDGDTTQNVPSTGPTTDWQLAMAHPKTPPRDPFGLPPVTPPGKHSTLRRRVAGRRSGQGLTSGSPGDLSKGQNSFLEGWTQYAAVQLDRGGGIPALGGANPVRALGSVSRAGRTRLSTSDAREHLGGRQ